MLYGALVTENPKACVKKHFEASGQESIGLFRLGFGQWPMGARLVDGPVSVLGGMLFRDECSMSAILTERH